MLRCGNMGYHLFVNAAAYHTDVEDMQFFELVARVDASFVGETWFHPVQDEMLPNLRSASARASSRR
jgi:hypothetical protein